MSKADSLESDLITSMTFFKPFEKGRTVVSSLEEWASRILTPCIGDLTNRKELLDKESSARLKRAKTPNKITKFNGKKCQKRSLVECGWYFITPSRATIRLSCGRPFSFLTSPDFFCVPHMHHLSLNFG
jgi:hypothetical protein